MEGQAEGAGVGTDTELFQQKEGHDVRESVPTSKEQKAKVTRAFFEAFFHFSAEVNQVTTLSVEKAKVKWFYEVLIPASFRQREQEWGKMRTAIINERLNKRASERLMPQVPGQEVRGETCVEASKLMVLRSGTEYLQGCKGPLPFSEKRREGWNVLHEVLGFNLEQLKTTVRDIDKIWEARKEGWQRGQKRKRGNEEKIPLNIYRLNEQRVSLLFAVPGPGEIVFTINRPARTYNIEVSRTAPSLPIQERIVEEMPPTKLVRHGKLPDEVDIRAPFQRERKDGLYFVTFQSYNPEEEIITTRD